MKFFIFISALFTILGCSNKLSEQVDYYNTPFPSKGFSIPTLMQPPIYVIHEDQTYEIPPPPPRIYVPSAPSSSLVIPAQPNFIPVMPEESTKKIRNALDK